MSAESDAVDRKRLMGLTVGASLATLMVELWGDGGGIQFIEVDSFEFALLLSEGGAGLERGNYYVITDFEQGRVTGDLYVFAISAYEVDPACFIITDYDPRPWRGVFDIGSKQLVELADNQGNVCRQFPATFFTRTPIDDFDWGNPSYTNCLVDNARWFVDYGYEAEIDMVTVNEHSTFDLRGWTGDSLTNLTITGWSEVDFSNSDTGVEEFEARSGSGIVINNEGGHFLFQSKCENSFITVSENADSEFYMESCSLQGYSGVYHRVEGFLSLLATNITAFGEVRTGGTAGSPVGSITSVEIENCELSGVRNSGGPSSRGASINIVGTNSDDIVINRSRATGGASIRITTATNNVNIYNTEADSYGLLNVTTAGTIQNSKISQGELANAGYDLTNVYMMGTGTKTCTANNSDKGKDYFNDNIT